MASRSRVIYIGVTSNIGRRVEQHKRGDGDGFSSRNDTTSLVYFEDTPDVNVAIAREKQLKRWRREKKVWLIESVNATWSDLSAEWFREE